MYIAAVACMSPEMVAPPVKVGVVGLNRCSVEVRLQNTARRRNLMVWLGLFKLNKTIYDS